MAKLRTSNDELRTDGAPSARLFGVDTRIDRALARRPAIERQETNSSSNAERSAFSRHERSSFGWP
jgi:hypothetical protein